MCIEENLLILSQFCSRCPDGGLRMKRELGANPEQSRCCVPFDCTSNLLPLTYVGKADVWGKSEDLQNQLNHVYSRKVCVGTVFVLLSYFNQ